MEWPRLNRLGLLFAGVCAFVRWLGRDVGLRGEQTGEGGTLLIGKFTAGTVGVQQRLSLGWRHLAKIAEGAGDQAAAVDGKAVKFAHGVADLLLLSGVEVLNGFVALQHPATLLGGHVIELRQLVSKPLLALWRKIAEAW